MSTLVLVVIIVILLGGLGYGGGLYGGGGNRYWGTAAQPGYGIGGIIGAIIVVADFAHVAWGHRKSVPHRGDICAGLSVRSRRITLAA